MINSTTPRGKYTMDQASGGGGSWGTPTLKKKKPVWGIPGSNSLPSGVANSTNQYPTDVNSKNPTAGNVTPSSAAATGTQQGSNAPINTPQPSKARDVYASNLASIQEAGKTLVSDFDDYKKDQEAGGDSKQSYIDALKAEQFPSTFKAEQDSRDKAATRLAKVQSDREAMELEARRAYEEALDAPGGTVDAANQAAQLVRRRSNTELADVALQENAALRAAQVAQGIFESAQGQDRQLTIEEIQILNEGGANLQMGSTISEARASGIFPSGAGGATEGVASLAQLVMSGEMDMSGIPAELRGAVADAVAAGGGITDQTNQMSPYQEERITRNLNSIEDLMGQVTGWTTGMGSLIANVPGTPAANFRADVNTLSANIAFGELTAMREASKTGGALGQVSERELALLEAALGSLDRAQSPEQFKKSLDTIKSSIERWQAAVQEHGGEAEGGEEGEGLYDW